MKYILAVLALGVMIIVHELGHFIMAKLNNVKVEEFSIGMGPKIFTYKGKETNYSLSLLPIGGYVSMYGQDEEVDDDRGLLSKSPLRRISISIAGIFMNFLLAVVIFTAVLGHYGYTDTKIDKLTDDGALMEAGVEEGSVIKEINGSKILTYYDIALCTDISHGKELNIKYEYKGKDKSITITPKPIVENGEERYIMGATFTRNTDPTIGDSISQSFKQTGTLVKQTVKTLINLVTGKGSFKNDLGGPVTVVKMSAQAAESGLWDLIYLVGLMSISLAVFNLIPFPALDGGWTLMLFIELITRKKVPEKAMAVMNGIGFILLMILMVAVTVKDLIYVA